MREIVGRETLLKRLAQDLEDMPPELRPFIQEEHAVVRQRHLARHGDVPATDQPDIRDRMMRVTSAVRAPVQPAMRWMRVVSRASARIMVGRMVVSRRASLYVPAPGGPSSRTSGSERRHRVQLRFSIAELTRAGWQDPAAGPGGVGEPRLGCRMGPSPLAVSRRCRASARRPLPSGHCAHAVGAASLLARGGSPHRHADVIGSASRSADRGVTAGPCPPPSAGKTWARLTGTPPGGMGPAGHT